MKVLPVLLKKEFKQIFRDSMIVRIIFMLPAIQLLVLPFAADYEIRVIKVGIIDQDMSSTSRSIVQALEYSNYFHLSGYSHDYQEGLDWIESDKTDLFLNIPANFEKDLVRENEAGIFMAVNAVNGVKAYLGASYALQIIQEKNQQIRREWIPESAFSPGALFDVKSAKWYNPESDFQVFMVPGILAILMTMVGGFLTALNIVREKEIGTIEQLNVTPIRKYEFIMGKLIPFWLLGLVTLTIGIIISFLVHGIVPGANIGVLYLFSMVYLLAVLGFGFLISNYTETQQQAMMVAFFFMLIFILMSGLFTPIESMPVWAQWIARINPVTYGVDVMRMVLLKGANLVDIIPHLKVIGLEAAVLNFLAIWSYRKQS
jgi:ABC-2 type transport system permease protein